MNFFSIDQHNDYRDNVKQPESQLYAEAPKFLPSEMNSKDYGFGCSTDDNIYFYSSGINSSQNGRQIQNNNNNRF